MVGTNEQRSSIPDADFGAADAALPRPAVAKASENNRSNDAQRWLTEHGGALWRFALLRLRSHALAEEIVQETLLAAMKSAAGPASIQSERSWLLGIASHKIADHFRAESKRARLTQPPAARAANDGDTEQDGSPESSPGLCFTPDGRWARLPEAWGDPSGGAERAEQLARLRGCMDALPPSLDQTIWLREVLGLNAPDVCAILALTPQALWTRLHRARAALRECMERPTAAAPRKKGPA